MDLFLSRESSKYFSWRTWLQCLGSPGWMCILSEQRRWSRSSSSLSMSLSLPLCLRSPGACAPVAPFRHNKEQRGQCHCSALAQPSGHSHVRVVVRKQHRGELAFLGVPSDRGATYACWEPNRVSWLVALSLRVAWASMTAGHLCSNPHQVPPFPPPLSDLSSSPLHLSFAFHLCSLGEPSLLHPSAETMDLFLKSPTRKSAARPHQPNLPSLMSGWGCCLSENYH